MQNVMNRRKRMYLRGSNECRKLFCDYCTAKTSASRSLGSTKAGTTSSVVVGVGRISRQHSLNHQRTSRILCLSCSDSFQPYGSKPTRGHVMGKQKVVRRQTEQPTLMWPLLRAQGNRRIKNFVARSGPAKPSGSGLKRVKD